MLTENLQNLAAEILALARNRGNAQLACAESCTGGAIASALTDIPGMSSVFRGGVVAYATAIKTSVLDVPEALIEQHGVVSCKCAEAMARGATRALNADFAVSSTGVAGPGPQDGIPAGTVCIGIATPTGTHAEQYVFADASREGVKALATETALRLLRDALKNNP